MALADNLLEQCDLIDVDMAAVLCGFHSPTAAFRNALREVPALAGQFTVGDVARAYLRHTLGELERIGVENAAEAAATEKEGK